MEERQASTGWLFFQFLGNLLAALPGVTDLQSERATPGSTDVGADFIGRFEGRPLLIEAKAQTPQTIRRVQQSVEQLRAAWQASAHQFGPHQQPRLVIAFPGVLSPKPTSTAR